MKNLKSFHKKSYVLAIIGLLIFLALNTFQALNIGITDLTPKEVLLLLSKVVFITGSLVGIILIMIIKKIYPTPPKED